MDRHHLPVGGHAAGFPNYPPLRNPGNGAGQFAQPGGFAVGARSGDRYFADRQYGADRNADRYAGTAPPGVYSGSAPGAAGPPSYSGGRMAPGASGFSRPVPPPCGMGGGPGGIMTGASGGGWGGTGPAYARDARDDDNFRRFTGQAPPVPPPPYATDEYSHMGGIHRGGGGVGPYIHGEAGSQGLRHPGGVHAVGSTVPYGAPERQDQQHEPPSRPRMVDRKLSLESEKTLGQLVDFEREFNEIDRGTQEIQEALLRGETSAGQAKTDLALLEANLDKLQCKGVDSIETMDLHSGKERARALRKELTKRAEGMHERMDALFKEIKRRLPHS